MSGSESENDGAKQFLVSKSATKDGGETADTADSINQQERLDILSSSSSRSVVAVQSDVELFESHSISRRETRCLISWSQDDAKNPDKKTVDQRGWGRGREDKV